MHSEWRQRGDEQHWPALVAATASWRGQVPLSLCLCNEDDKPVRCLWSLWHLLWFWSND